MPVNPIRPTLTLLLACLVLLPLHGAQAQDGARWFRVELLIFSNEFNTAGEQWEATPRLSYPNAARFLIDPARVAANLKQHRGTGVVDEYGRQILTPAGSTADKPQTTSSAAEQAMPSPRLPTPFTALPASQREFRGKAAYMQRSGRYRTLFHETWVQPVRDQGSSLPLVLDRSGDTQQWPRLQGSVTLYLSRYLHIETNLWLNTTGDYLPGTWRMPAPPLGPPALVIEALPGEQSAPAQDTSNPWAVDTNKAALYNSGESALDPQEVAGPIYPWRHAVSLRQKRRMRSTEVHYIDHPLLGVVVKLSPITEEELTALAAAEQAVKNGSQAL